MAKPKPKPTAEAAVIDQFVTNLQRGIVGPESGGDYSAQNKEGSAAGKYQFTAWWLDKAGDKSIQSYAKQSGVFDVPKDMEDFKKNPALQDAYFRYYAKEVLYPHAKKAFQGENPAGLTLEEMGAIFHFKPPTSDKYGNTGAYKQISTGVFDKATKKGENGAAYSNAGTLQYLKKFNEALETTGAKPIDKKTLVEAEVEKKINKEEVIADYKKRYENINKLDVSDKEKERLRGDLMRKAVANGTHEIINEAITADVEKFESGKKLYEIFGNSAVEYTSRNEKDKPFIKSITSKPIDKEEAEQLLEQFPALKEHAFVVKDGGQTVIKVNNKGGRSPREFQKVFNNTFKEWAGEEAAAKLNIDVDGDRTWLDNFTGKSIDGKGTFSTKNLKFDQLAPAIATTIDPELLPGVEKPKRSDKWDEEIKKGKPSNDEIVIGEVKSKSRGQEELDKKESDAAEKWLDTEAGLLASDGQQMNYDKSKFKKDLPIDAFTGMALGLIGNEQAKNADIPLRTEEVSEAVKNYTADLARKSKEGLPVEVEAAMRNQLAEVYQGGLQNIVNASAGNRATVLGNQGTLENARAKGIIDMQLADYEAKEKAFQQYGQAIKYINDFDANRDIANTQLRQQQGLLKQQEGKQLATAGFKQLSDSIRYQKENGPGSANHMYKSALMQRIFGFNPMMKDDGSGNTVGTKSWYDKNRAKREEDLGIVKSYTEKLEGLSSDKRKLANKYWEKNGRTQGYKFIDHLVNNPELAAEDISLDNVDFSTPKPTAEPTTYEGLAVNTPKPQAPAKAPVVAGAGQGLLYLPEMPTLKDEPAVSQGTSQGLLETPVTPEPSETDQRLAAHDEQYADRYAYYENQ